MKVNVSGEITRKWQNHCDTLCVKQMRFPSIIAVTLQTTKMKFEKLFSLVKKPQLQSVLIFLSLSIHALICIWFVIYTFLECFERLFSSFTQFGGSFHCLNFDKFRDTAPLSNNWTISPSLWFRNKVGFHYVHNFNINPGLISHSFELFKFHDLPWLFPWPFQVFQDLRFRYHVCLITPVYSPCFVVRSN